MTMFIQILAVLAISAAILTAAAAKQAAMRSSKKDGEQK